MKELIEALNNVNGVVSMIDISGKKYVTLRADEFKKDFCDREHKVNYDGNYLKVSVEEEGIEFSSLMNFDEYKDYLMYF